MVVVVGTVVVVVVFVVKADVIVIDSDACSADCALVCKCVSSLGLRLLLLL